MTRVLVVDDSSFMRKTLTHLLESDDAIHVVDTAADGAEAFRKVVLWRPDVILLDLEMSGVDGLAALTQIMAQQPTPVLVLTGLNTADATIAMECLERGAVDVIAKPSGVISYDIDALRSVIIDKVKVAASVCLGNVDPHLPGDASRLSPAAVAGGGKMIVIGASTGGPRALTEIVPSLPRLLPAAVLIVQHMDAVFVPYFAQTLKAKCRCDVAVAREDELCASGRVLLAPGGCHTLIVRDDGVPRVRFSTTASLHAFFPSIDDAMTSVATAYGPDAVGVLLTGTGSDGALGMKALKEAGGRTIAEAPATCLAPGMPQAAIDLGCVDEVVALPFVARMIAEIACGARGSRHVG